MTRSMCLLTCCFTASMLWSQHQHETQRLIGAMLGPNTMIDNLESLTDEIGGRPTGSEANRRSVAWGRSRFEERGVAVTLEPFSMPMLWQEQKTMAQVEGDHGFEVGVIAMPYSAATDPDGMTAPLVDVGYGAETDFRLLGPRLRGAFALVHTHELRDLPGLFREYTEAVQIDRRANAAGVAGVVYMSSRPKNLLYRHNASRGVDNTLPMLIMEREDASRIARLLDDDNQLSLRIKLDLTRKGPYTAHNVIGEIKGSADPEEIVVIGAHLDSWDLGTGALDNGCNVAMMIEIAAQMTHLNLKPRRTIRFCLWNGEEQGLFGSYGYTLLHRDEMDAHVMAMSIDIGSGALRGFFVDGPKPFDTSINAALLSVESLGPFQHVVAPIVGTDNYDFMMQGVATLVGNQESANYGPHYHAESDTFDKVDQRQLKINAAIVAAVTWHYANAEVTWHRRTKAQLDQLIANTDLQTQMQSFGTWKGWVDGTRGRNKVLSQPALRNH